MTHKSFKHAAYGLVGFCLVLLFLSVQMRDSNTQAANSGSALPSATPAPTPTRSRYNCGDVDNPDYITFKWTRPMPNGGWLGEVSYGQIINKPVQVFDSKVNETTKIVDWTFQAQDGSFLCHMYVSPPILKRNVWFGACKNNVWPQPTCGTDRLTETATP